MTPAGVHAGTRSAAGLALAMVLLLAWPGLAVAVPGSPLPGSVAPQMRSAAGLQARVAGLGADPPEAIILAPGQIRVSRGGREGPVIPAPALVDLADLVSLVDDAALISESSDGVVELRVRIEQRAGSRLAISAPSVHEVRFFGGARLAGSGALLSIQDVLLVAKDVVLGPESGLVAYSGGSAVRMTRVRIQDQRSGSGAGPAFALSGGAQVHLRSVLVSGGHGVRLDDAHPAELIGVQIEGARGPGLTVIGSTQLRLRHTGIRGSSGDGLVLIGRGVRVRTGGWISSTGNGGAAVRLIRTRDLTPADLNLSTAAAPVLKVPSASAADPGAVADPVADGTARGTGSRDDMTTGDAHRQDGARLPLSWVVLAGLLILGAAAALEVQRPRARIG